jgi:hypothetical protein
MANQGNFASTPHNTSTSLTNTAETDLGTPAHAVSCFVAGTNGSKIEEMTVTVASTGVTPVNAAGLIYLFLYDGTNYHYYDTITMASTTGSTTTAPGKSSPSRYPNLWIASGWSLYASVSVIATSPAYFQLHVFGGDY